MCYIIKNDAKTIAFNRGVDTGLRFGSRQL
jgi:hypothetical protein